MFLDLPGINTIKSLFKQLVSLMLLDMFPFRLHRNAELKLQNLVIQRCGMKASKHIRKLPIFDHPKYQLFERFPGPAVPVISKNLGLTTSEIDMAE